VGTRSEHREQLPQARGDEVFLTDSGLELDEAAELDDGDPEELAADYCRLRSQVPNLSVLGCCGTDARHIGAIAAACLA